MDTVSNHVTKKMPSFQNTPLRRHCLNLRSGTESSPGASGSSTKSFRLSELFGALWVGWKPYRGERVWGGFWNMYSGSGSCSSKEGFKQNHKDGKTWVWASMQTSQCAFRWCLLSPVPKCQLWNKEYLASVQKAWDDSYSSFWGVIISSIQELSDWLEILLYSDLSPSRCFGLEAI